LSNDDEIWFLALLRFVAAGLESFVMIIDGVMNMDVNMVKPLNGKEEC